MLADLYDGLQKIRRETYPFANLPEKKRGRSGQGITPALMKLCHWVDPRPVAQVQFTEWTSEDQLRQKRAPRPSICDCFRRKKESISRPPFQAGAAIFTEIIFEILERFTVPAYCSHLWDYQPER